jgi:2-polyprenyl-3-methyl-5-hydroxy-6-metoxy-1,4-benzoquinol methylase
MGITGDWFKDWFNSPYYHQLYFRHDDKEAADFVNKLVDYLRPDKESLILDVACGRGRHSRILASYGFDVTGTDLSAESIEEAKKSENERLHFFVHDMRLPFWINYFNYAVNLFTSFGYFKSEREHYNVIRTISNSIKPNGTFVMDYLNTHYDEDHLVHKADKEIGGVNFHMTKWFDETHFYKKIIVEDENLKEPLEYQEKVAKFSLGDFNDMFAFHHLQMQEVFGDYQFNKYNIKDSPRLIMIAKKVQK